MRQNSGLAVSGEGRRVPALHGLFKTQSVPARFPAVPQTSAVICQCAPTPAVSCEVQAGQREAFKGMLEAQNGQSLVFGGAGAGVLFIRLIWRTSRNTAKATSMK